MTREEAIEILWRYDVNFEPHPPEEVMHAIDMAIEALKILGDDGIVNCCGCIHWKTDGGAMMICELWDTPMGDFDYCSYGKREKPTIPMFAESAESYKAWTGEEMGKTHGRLIDVDALLDKLPKEYLGSTVHLLINNAPTVSADRPHGEWIVEPFRNNWEFKCSICGWYEYHAYKDTQRHNYCPNCGALMLKGGDTE